MLYSQQVTQFYKSCPLKLPCLVKRKRLCYLISTLFRLKKRYWQNPSDVLLSPSCYRTRGRGRRVFEQSPRGVREVSRAYAAHDSEQVNSGSVFIQFTTSGQELCLSAMLKEKKAPWAAVNLQVITQRYVFYLNYTNGCGPSSPKEEKIASSSSCIHSMTPTYSTKIEDSLADLASRLSRLRPLNSGVICISP